MCGCISHTLDWGPGPQPRHEPWLGIEPATLWVAGRHSIHWATPARAIFFFSLHFLLLFKYRCLYFPYTNPPTQPSQFPPLILTLFGFVHVSFIDVPENLLPSSPIIPSYLPSGYCHFVVNFNVSGYILLACLFCWLDSTYMWDHIVFVFHHLAYFTFSYFYKLLLFVNFFLIVLLWLVFSLVILYLFFFHITCIPNNSLLLVSYFLFFLFRLCIFFHIIVILNPTQNPSLVLIYITILLSFTTVVVNFISLTLQHASIPYSHYICSIKPHISALLL